MKNCLPVLAANFAILLASSAYGQGTINFNNHLPAEGIDAPVFDIDGTTRLAGSIYMAELYAGPTPATLAPVGQPVPFRTGVGAGYWDAGTTAGRAVASVAPGATASVQIRVWQTIKGKTFEEAAAAGSKTGSSEILTLALGGVGQPPSLPVNLAGLKSFQLSPPLSSPLAPIILSQPASRVVKEGRTVTFVVQARNATAFQWQRQTDGQWIDIASATSATLTLANVQKTDAGDYRVVVSGAASSVTSQTATLRVFAPPAVAHGKVKHDSDGKFEMDVDADDGVDYHVEVSDDLVEWQPLPNIPHFLGSKTIVDDEAVHHAHRFYRVVAEESGEDRGEGSENESEHD